MGYDVVVEDGRFLSRDGRHAMLIVQTTVPMTDATRSKELVRVLDEKIRQLPSFVSADVIAGHLHTVSNEQVIKRDIAVASVVASIGFLFLFLFVFRDARAFFVILFPLLAVVWAIIIQGLVAGHAFVPGHRLRHGDRRRIRLRFDRLYRDQAGHRSLPDGKARQAGVHRRDHDHLQLRRARFLPDPRLPAAGRVLRRLPGHLPAVFALCAAPDLVVETVRAGSRSYHRRPPEEVTLAGQDRRWRSGRS